MDIEKTKKLAEKAIKENEKMLFGVDHAGIDSDVTLASIHTRAGDFDIDELKTNMVKFAEEIHGFKLHPWQKEFMEMLSKRKTHKMVISPPRFGKNLFRNHLMNLRYGQMLIQKPEAPIIWIDECADIQFLKPNTHLTEKYLEQMRREIAESAGVAPHQYLQQAGRCWRPGPRAKRNTITLKQFLRGIK